MLVWEPIALGEPQSTLKHPAEVSVLAYCLWGALISEARHRQNIASYRDKGPQIPVTEAWGVRLGKASPECYDRRGWMVTSFVAFRHRFPGPVAVGVDADGAFTLD